MAIDLCAQLIIMSAVGSMLHLTLNLVGKATIRYFKAAWLYYTSVAVYMLLLLPFHRLLPLLSFSQGIENETLYAMSSAVFPSTGINALAAAIKAEPIAVAGFNVLLCLFAAGTLVFITVMITQSHRLRRRILGTCRITDEANVLESLLICKQKIGISKNTSIDVYVSSYANTPFLYGIFKPRIVLPEMKFTAEELNHIFSHELIHWKRHDAWLKCLILSVNAFHWFNPLIYMAGRDIERHSELSCDERVVAEMNKEERGRYCTLMLNMLCSGSNGSGHTAFSAFSDDGKQFERRVRIIMDGKGIKSKSRFRALALVIASAFILGGTAFIYAAATAVSNGVAAYDDDVVFEGQLADDIVVDGQLPIDPETGEFIWPIADGIDNGVAAYDDNVLFEGQLADDIVFEGQLPIDPETGEFIWPIADGIDNGQFLPQ